MTEPAVLNSIEGKRYQKLKAQIGLWWNDRFKIGEALGEIRDSELYRVEYETFEAFVLTEYGFKRAQAYRLIEAAAVKESVALSPIGDKLTNEGQARALALVPDEQRAQVLEAASSAGEVTAKTITEAARQLKAKATEKPAEQLDKTGYPIPESILPEWLRATDVAQGMLTRISQLRTELKSGLKSDPIFAEVTNTTVADFDNAYTSIKCVRPYAVCSSCAGHNRKRCNLCKGRGFLSEFAWESYVPAEIKKMRGK
jgi:hypothetical protein